MVARQPRPGTPGTSKCDYLRLHRCTMRTAAASATLAAAPAAELLEGVEALGQRVAAQRLGLPHGGQDAPLLHALHGLARHALELHDALDLARQVPVDLRLRAAVPRLHQGVRHVGLHVLVRLLDVQREEDRVLLRVHRALEAAEVGPPEGARLLEVVRGVAALAPGRERALQRHAGRPVEEERAHAVRAVAVAGGVEDELHALDAGGVEGHAAHGLARGEAAPQQGRVLQAPLDAPHHARAHELHLLLHLVHDPVVDVPARHDQPFQRLHRQLGLVRVRGQRGRLDGVLDVPDRLEDLDADAEGVVLPVDLVLEEAEALGAVRHAAVEDLLQRRHLLAQVELVDQAHALAGPEEDGAVPRGLVLHGRVRGPEELQLQLQAVGAGHVELR
mmetsp:Transcript_116427/g.361777  ORF Transcript_116427/g.361777 Transcript_116427/m.361777 type:complete len:390 (-) Transcript_116427:1025-2194(-)